MIVIAGYVLVDPSERDTYVAAHRDLVSRARAADGCLHVAITADSVDDARVYNIEVWRDADALDSWRGRANAPVAAELREIVVQRYDATDGGPLF